MGSKKAVLYLFSIFFIAFFAFANRSAAQRLEPLSNGSIYVSVGYSKAWFFPSTLHIQQEEAGNYFRMKVKADNLSNTSISVWQLSYRIGYYYDFQQEWGVELNFDPVNFHVKENSIVQVKGTFNNVPNIKKNVLFTSKNGYYYAYNGANLLLLNLVRRVGVYNNRRNNIRVDALGKLGVGPAFPHVISSLPTNPMSGPQFGFAGWNGGLELGIRGTFFRYVYLEIAGKYDYARMHKLKVSEGTAQHDFHTYSAIASLGFTFPTSKGNPLFRRPHKITTILPFYSQAKLLREGSGDADDPNDSTDHNRFKEIPQFEDILEKEAEEAAALYLALHPPDTFNNMDSIAAVENRRFADSATLADSLMKQDSADHVFDSLNSKKERKRRKRELADSIKNAQKAMQDSLTNAGKETDANQTGNGEVPPPVADTAAAPPAEPAEEKLSKKDEKKKAKQEKKEAKKREKEAAEEAKRKAKEEEDARKAKEEEEANKKAEEEKPKEEAPSEPPKDGN